MSMTLIEHQEKQNCKENTDEKQILDEEVVSVREEISDEKGVLDEKGVSNPDIKLVAGMAMEAGRILLKNGGEIFRVAETISRICKRFGATKVDTFTMGHGIFLSVENEAGEIYTKVQHVPLSAQNLEIVAAVNDLSRRIASGEIGISEAKRQLEIIDRIQPPKAYIQILASGIASGMFAVLLGSTIPEGIGAFLIGCITYMWVIYAGRREYSKIIINVVGGILITVLSILIINIPGLHELTITGMLSGAIMSLIPGVAFVNGIRDIADSDFLSGMVRMLDAISVFLYIALGVGVSLGVYGGIVGGTLL